MKRGDQAILGNLMGRNFGDDLMLLGLLRAEPTQGRRVVLSQATPAGTVKLPSDVIASQLSARKLFSEARRTGTVVTAGGTHLQYLRSHPRLPQHRALVKWLVVYGLVRMLGTKLEMRAVGMGPFESRLSGILARWCCRLQSRITVRDCRSLELVRSSWKFPAEFEEDLAMHYLRWWSEQVWHPADLPGGRYTVVAPAYSNFHLQWWLEHVRLHVPRGERIVLFAAGRQSSGSDRTINRHIASALSRDYPCTFYDFSGDVASGMTLLAGASRVIAARYHVILAARVLRREVIADVYHPKVKDALMARI